MRDLSYDAVIARKNEIMKRAVGIDYEKYMIGELVFDYEKMMQEVGYSLEKVREIQQETGVGNTTLVELKQINRLIKKLLQREKAQEYLLKMRQQILLEATKIEGHQLVYTMRKNMDTKELLLQQVETMEQLLHPKQQKEDLNV
jgi:hypothetical protein